MERVASSTIASDRKLKGLVARLLRVEAQLDQDPADRLTAFFEQILIVVQKHLDGTTSAPPAEQFSDVFALPTDLRMLVRAFGQRSAENDVASLAHLCRQLAEWAVQHQRPRAGCRFAVAGLKLNPDSAESYRALAYHLRRAGNPAAVRFYAQAIRRGKFTRQWEPVASAWLGLANAFRDRGWLRFARVCSDQAVRVAREESLPHIEAQALQNLAVVLFDLEEIAHGWTVAQKASVALKGDPQGLAVLANDLAWYWMMQTAGFALVLPLFQTALHAVDDPYIRLRIFGNIAHAAGGVRDEPLFEWACAHVEQLRDTLPAQHGTFDAMVGVARGALSLARWDLAIRAARMAIAAAQRRKEQATEAFGLLENATVHQRLDLRRAQKNLDEASVLLVAAERHGSVTPPLTEMSSSLVESDVRQLAEQIVNYLRMRKLDSDLAQMLHGPKRQDEAVLVGIRCDRSDVSRVERLIRDASGAWEQSVPQMEEACVYGKVRPNAFAKLIDDVAVHHVFLPMEYDVIQ